MFVSGQLPVRPDGTHTADQPFEVQARQAEVEERWGKALFRKFQIYRWNPDDGENPRVDHAAIAAKGWHAVEAALDYGVKVSGCTVHVATLEMDAGPILAQEAVPVLPDDTAAELHERIKQVERRLYPDTIRRFMEGTLR